MNTGHWTDSRENFQDVLRDQSMPVSGQSNHYANLKRRFQAVLGAQIWLFFSFSPSLFTAIELYYHYFRANQLIANWPALINK